jgi:8-oxo-dGTP diphosphatase
MIRVAAGIIFQNNKILVTRRGPGEKHAGCWEFPGGKLEASETFQQCIEREILEEIGLVVKANEILATSTYSYSNGSVELTAILCTAENMDIKLTVHDRYRFIAPKSLSSVDLLPADIPIAIKLGDIYG